MMRALLWLAVASLVVAAGCSGKGSGESAGEPQCAVSSDCPEGQVCVRVPCEGPDAPAGCGVFACNPECASPYGDNSSWKCSDDPSCCGYSCGEGICYHDYPLPETTSSSSSGTGTSDGTGTTSTSGTSSTTASTTTTRSSACAPACARSPTSSPGS